MWDSVLCKDRNSLITRYNVRYGRASSGVRETAVVSGSGTTSGSYTITGLTQFTNYSIGVAAVSDSGTGPFTAAIFVQTLSLDGEHARDVYMCMAINSIYGEETLSMTSGMRLTKVRQADYYRETNTVVCRSASRLFYYIIRSLYDDNVIATDDNPTCMPYKGRLG